MEKQIEIFKALASESRLRILLLLKEHPQCVGAIAKRLDMTQPAISQHLRVLTHAGLVRPKKTGYRVHYEMDRETIARHSSAMSEIFGGWVEPQSPGTGTSGCPPDLVRVCQENAPTHTNRSKRKTKRSRKLK